MSLRGINRHGEKEGREGKKREEEGWKRRRKWRREEEGEEEGKGEGKGEGRGGGKREGGCGTRDSRDGDEVIMQEEISPTRSGLTGPCAALVGWTCQGRGNPGYFTLKWFL